MIPAFGRFIYISVLRSFLTLLQVSSQWEKFSYLLDNSVILHGISNKRMLQLTDENIS